MLNRLFVLCLVLLQCVEQIVALFAVLCTVLCVVHMFAVCLVLFLVLCVLHIFYSLYCSRCCGPKGRLGISDVSPLSGILGLPVDSMFADGRGSSVEWSFRSKDTGFHPLVGQGERQFFCPSQSTPSYVQHASTFVQMLKIPIHLS